MSNRRQISDIEAARDVAANIRTVSLSLDEGRTSFLDDYDFNVDASYDSFISLLMEAGIADDDAWDGPPSDALRTAANPVLADLNMTIDDVYAHAVKGRRFFAQTVWERMRKAPDVPTEASRDYNNFHYSLEFLGVPSGSEEMCALLGTNMPEFKRVDRNFALASAFELFADHQILMQQLSARIQLKYADQGLAGRFRASEEFLDRYEKGMRQVNEDILRIMEKSGLNQQDVSFYVSARIESQSATEAPAGPKALH